MFLKNSHEMSGDISLFHGNVCWKMLCVEMKIFVLNLQQLVLALSISFGS